MMGLRKCLLNKGSGEESILESLKKHGGRGSRDLRISSSQDGRRKGKRSPQYTLIYKKRERGKVMGKVLSKENSGACICHVPVGSHNLLGAL